MSEPSEDIFLEWLDRALDDIAQIQNNLEGPEYRGRMVAFHAQQASEKLLKLLLLKEGIEPPYSHNLAKLEKLIKGGHTLKPLLHSILKFEHLNVLSRYPTENDAWQPPTQTEAKAWYEELNQLFNKVKDLINTP